MTAIDVSPPGVRVLAALGSAPAAVAVVRQAKRLADLAHAPWEAVHVATPDDDRAPASEREALLEAFRVAETLGGATRTLSGEDPAAELLAYAHRQGVTHIVAGGSSRPPWAELLQGSTTRKLIRDARDIAVEICPTESKRRGRLFGAARPSPIDDPVAYLLSTGFVGAATLIALPLDRTLALPNASLVYVLAVIGAAVRYGAAVAIFTAIVSSLAYNFFLTEPYYTFEIADPSNVWAVFFFLVVALAVSGVAARARAQTLIARRQATQAADLQSYAHSLVGAQDVSEIAATTAETASKLLQARAAVLVRTHDELESIAEAPDPEMLGADDMRAAQYAFEQGLEAGRGAQAVADARWLFVPAPGERETAGVVGVRLFDDAAPLDQEGRRLLHLLADQAGVALDRAQFARNATGARIETETERLKGELMLSMSHSLRTPLATIRGVIEELLRTGTAPELETQRELAKAAAEAEKLTGFVESVEGMARIDAGGVRAKHESVDVADLVDAAVDRSRRCLKGKFVSRDIKTGLPHILGDRALTESALARILENAGKHGPAKRPILVRAGRERDSIVIEVLDEGPGFVEAPSKLFGGFMRGVEGGAETSEAGFDLAIAKGFLEAQGATLEVAASADRAGGRVRMLLPIAGQ